MECKHLVVGGGIVGLAVASVLSQAGPTLLVEQHRRFLQETSSRNSGVVHAGIYYPSDSLKTQLCMAGNKHIWNLLDKYGSSGGGNFRARRCGKWIGASDAAEEGVLHALAQKMIARQIPHRWVPAKEVLTSEPKLSFRAVLESPNSGIVDVESLGDVFRDLIAAAPTESLCAPGNVLRSLRKDDSLSKGVTRYVATCESTRDKEKFEISAQHIVLCLGLHTNTFFDSIIEGCEDLKGAFDGLKNVSRTHFCRGSYLRIRGPQPVSRLVYPCPLPNLKGLGVHTVLDWDGSLKFGPNATYVQNSADLEPSIEAQAALINEGYAAIRRYMPSVKRENLYYDFSGMRPKLSAEGEPARDFLIETVPSQTESGSLTATLLAGIESPGLTASTAIAEYVARAIGVCQIDPIIKALPWNQ